MSKIENFINTEDDFQLLNVPSDNLIGSPSAMKSRKAISQLTSDKNVLNPNSELKEPFEVIPNKAQCESNLNLTDNNNAAQKKY